MITFAGVRKSYGAGEPVLRHIDATFGKGEVVAITGASGAGKSTLLRCINGLESFDAGSIRVEDATLVPGGEGANRAALVRVRRRVGFIFQTWNLFAHRTALGNVMEAPVHVRRWTRTQAQERAMTLLARVGLAHRAGAWPHELSGGEQQRVSIARALAMDPEVLLLDEPTSALDPDRKGDVVGVLRDLADSGMTMLLVTHDLDFARDVADRALVIAGGRVTADGDPERILARAGGATDRGTGAFPGSPAPRDVLPSGGQRHPR